MYDPEVALMAGNIFGLSSIYGVIIFIWLVFYLTYHYFIRYNKSLKYEAAINEIELNNLKSQLNPHFIFNALNSIRALIDENPKKSKIAVNQLSNILRNSLNTDKKRLTSFEDELKTVRDYLGLESMRYEERLKVQMDIHPDSNRFLVPPLMIQTLIENGIKHGISHLKEGGKIHLSTMVANGSLNIEIRNSGKYVFNGRNMSKRTGLGIRNTKQRLKLIYGDEAKFKIFNEGNNVVLTQIIIPEIIEYESDHSR
ncbi:MAG: histidine kinase [Flavobacteriaceae bacterium]|nr:histidine kinase [Flavobacteriaceae bacterium]